MIRRLFRALPGAGERGKGCANYVAAGAAVIMLSSVAATYWLNSHVIPVIEYEILPTYSFLSETFTGLRIANVGTVAVENVTFGLVGDARAALVQIESQGVLPIVSETKDVTRYEANIGTLGAGDTFELAIHLSNKRKLSEGDINFYVRSAKGSARPHKTAGLLTLALRYGPLTIIAISFVVLLIALFMSFGSSLLLSFTKEPDDRSAELQAASAAAGAQEGLASDLLPRTPEPTPPGRKPPRPPAGSK